MSHEPGRAGQAMKGLLDDSIASDDGERALARLRFDYTPCIHLSGQGYKLTQEAIRAILNTLVLSSFRPAAIDPEVLAATIGEQTPAWMRALGWSLRQVLRGFFMAFGLLTGWMAFVALFS